MCPPGYYRNGFVATRALGQINRISCAQVPELPQSHSGDNREGTLFSWFHIYYVYLASVRFEHSVCRGSLMTTYICIYTLWIYSLSTLENTNENKIFFVRSPQVFWQSSAPGALTTVVTSVVLYPSHTDESWEGQNTCLCIYIYIYIYIYISLSLSLYIYIYIYICMYVCMYVFR